MNTDTQTLQGSNTRVMSDWAGPLLQERLPSCIDTGEASWGPGGGMIWVWQKQLRHNDPKDLWETANIVKLSLSKKSSSMESLYREFVMKID